MSDSDSSCRFHQKINRNSVICEGWEGLEDENRKLKRREKNRVSARRSRNRQTQRADHLHQACELLEQRNRKLRREVDCLSEEQRELSDALKAHEPFCPIMHCSLASSCSLQPDTIETHSV
ncbi:basic leucine zipper transcriptional factor ATF-like 3 [Xyrichtys novacula]|uniref:Basic leucine zipper transcriptional factor ATF-like 3 n=1 Tax=Xyrichtys novacula TaxID=13765 RepID=A0AAV1GZ09_XYRNO|nr:basic leucine zipper transcriptional factor ATF-like 3 [Xyrichtys novacula]